MTRKWFLGLLGLSAAGQASGQNDDWVSIRTKVSAPDRKLPVGKSGNGSNEWIYRKPLNNQCPVCGTMAPKYGRETFGGGTTCTTGVPPVCTQTYGSMSPGSRTVSCSHCRARFDQDAEDVK